MKKIIACISLVCAMSAGVTAMAATTATPSGNSSDNSVTVSDATAYKTVLITEKGNADNIVYVDQNDSGFGTSTNFLLKNDAGYGEYTVKMGGDESTSFDFTIAPAAENVAATAEGIKLVSKATDKDDYGFKFDNQNMSGIKYLQFTAKKGAETKTSLVTLDSTFTGESTVDLAVKVTGVPTYVTLSVGLVK